MKKKNKDFSIGYKKKLPLMVYLILLICSGVYISFYGGAFSYVLFFTLLIYIPTALLHLLYTRFALRIYQEVTVRLLYKNTAVPYQISIENAGLLPIGGLRLVRDRTVTHFKKDFTTEVFRLLPKENRVIETDISCRYAGGYTAGIARIGLSDLFGIINISYDIPAPLRLHVLPTVTDIAAVDIGRLYEENLNQSSMYKIDKKEDYPGNELRKYMDGDPLNYVHWKNYARTGEMYVRLPDRQDSEMMTFLIVSDEDASIETRDYMLEYVVSAANWFAEQSKPVRFMYYCSGVKDYLIDGYDSFSGFYFEKLSEIGREASDESENKLMEALDENGGMAAVFRETNGELSLRK